MATLVMERGFDYASDWFDKAKAEGLGSSNTGAAPNSKLASLLADRKSVV